MLMCDNIATLIHHEKGIDGDTYICSTFDRVSWHKRNTITTSGDGAKPANTYEARIMTADDINVSLGDYLARGKVEGIEKPSDLAGLDKFRITAIGDNRRGGLAHWRLSGQ